MSALPERSRLVQQHLDAGGVHTEIRVLPDSARTAAEAAAAIGCDVAAIANSLVFLADGSPVLVMTSGGHRADLAALALGIGARAVTMAPASLVRDATGQAIGGVAPVGHPAPLRTYIDESLSAHEEIWAAAGHPHTVRSPRFSTSHTAPSSPSPDPNGLQSDSHVAAVMEMQKSPDDWRESSGLIRAPPRT